MATILKRNGRRSIQFMNEAGKRKTLALGKVTQKQAESIKTKVEALAAACITGFAPDDEVSAWLAKRDKVMLDRLAAVGLIPKRETATLEPFIEKYIASRSDVKPATKEVWRQGRLGLVKFFSVDRRMRDVTPGDADNYKMHLLGLGLAEMTVRKRLQFAKTIFRAAVRHKLIATDPFAEVGIKAGMPDRKHFITIEDTEKLLDSCPSLDWRLIVSLARYGGLRCPSEVLSVRWDDIDWENNRIVVTSPKTEHHPGKGTRVIPLFPELREVLEDAYFDTTREGTVYVVNEKFRKASQGKAGWRNCNLRTTFKKIVQRAGLKPWPRLFHNLRSSRQTELAERFPSHVVCNWLGNSEEIAQKHYYQVTADHFRAATTSCAALQPALQQSTETPRKDWQEADHEADSKSGEQGDNASDCKGLPDRTPACAADLSPCDERENGWGGIRTTPEKRGYCKNAAHSAHKTPRLTPIWRWSSSDGPVCPKRSGPTSWRWSRWRAGSQVDEDAEREQVKK